MSDGTRTQQRTSINRAARVLGTSRIDTITAHDVAAMVATIAGEGAKPSYVRKVLQATAMLFDHAGIAPNPARDKVLVKPPRDVRDEIAPPTAAHVLAVHRLLPDLYRLPLLVLDATGMRLGELEALTWGDMDEPRGRWRITAAVSKTSRARWVTPPPVVFDTVTALVPREDRTPDRRVFQGSSVTGSAPRSPVPAPPLPSRRSAPTICVTGAFRCRTWAVSRGPGSVSMSASGTFAVTANTYSHVMVDEAELDYAAMLETA